MTSHPTVGYDGMWTRPEDDPRTESNPVGELATIREYLSNYRLTLGMKCQDLTPEQLATNSVPPSTLSLLGLIRHMARVEHNWFYRRLRGHQDAPRLYALTRIPISTSTGPFPTPPWSTTRSPPGESRSPMPTGGWTS